ncbi:MAG: hypothetical protein ACOYOL_13120 [Chthoniobacterales bacterium]
MNVYITRYAKSRYWAVYHNDKLLAVTLYKRGANAIVQVLLALGCTLEYEPAELPSGTY